MNKLFNRKELPSDFLILNREELFLDAPKSPRGAKHKKLGKNGPSLNSIMALAEQFDCSVSYILRIDDFPDEFEKGLSCKNISANLRQFVSTHAPKIFFMKKQGFLREFPSFKNWLCGKTIPNTANFVSLAKALGLSAEDLLRTPFE